MSPSTKLIIHRLPWLRFAYELLAAQEVLCYRSTCISYRRWWDPNLTMTPPMPLTEIRLHLERIVGRNDYVVRGIHARAPQIDLTTVLLVLQRSSARRLWSMRVALAPSTQCTSCSTSSTPRTCAQDCQASSAKSGHITHTPHCICWEGLHPEAVLSLSAYSGWCGWWSSAALLSQTKWVADSAKRDIAQREFATKLPFLQHTN